MPEHARSAHFDHFSLMPAASMSVYFDCLLGSVSINFRRSKQSVRAYPDPRFVPIDLSTQEARQLAAALVAMADESDKWDADLNSYLESDANDEGKAHKTAFLSLGPEGMKLEFKREGTNG